MNDEAAIEQEIQDKGLTAPRITPEHIDSLIIGEEYVQAESWPTVEIGDQSYPVIRALNCLTVCVLVLKNGFTIVGKSGCASPESFNAELGRKIAKTDAREQIWALEDYLLKQRLADGAKAE